MPHNMMHILLHSTRLSLLLLLLPHENANIAIAESAKNPHDDDLDPTTLSEGYHYDDRYDGPGGHPDHETFFVEAGFDSVGDDDWGDDDEYAYDDELHEASGVGSAHSHRVPQASAANLLEELLADDAFVTKLDAKTFDLVVRDPAHDVLVAFVAPWCGHCKALAPAFAKAADELAADYPTLVLAKYDATAHAVPKGFDVSGYPTLLFVPAAAHALPQMYTGGRTAEEIVEWIKARALSIRRRTRARNDRAGEADDG